MLINPKAVERLRRVTVSRHYPYTTHLERNMLSRMFLEEAERLLDQKAEGIIKHVVELYLKGNISYEEYLERIEEVGKEEAERGASYGGAYARNRVFDFAERILDQERDRFYELSLVEAKKQHEQEKQLAEQQMKEIVQRYIAEIETAAHQHAENKVLHNQDLQQAAEQSIAEIIAIKQQYAEELSQAEEQVIERARDEIKKFISTELQEEKEKQEQVIQEREQARPAREATRTAMEHVALLQRKKQAYQRGRAILAGLGVSLFAILLVLLLFFSLPQWASVLFLVMIVSLGIILYFWKSPVSESVLALAQREVALFQTKGGLYASLNEDERRALFIQRIFGSPSLPEPTRYLSAQVADETS